MLIAWLVSPALAHDYVLEGTPRQGGGTSVHGIVAHDRQREPRRERPETLTRLERITSDEAVTVLPAEEGVWGWVPDSDEVTVVVYENSGAEVELPWDEFRNYVRTEGDVRQVSQVERVPVAPQREHYRRSLKLLVGVESGRTGWERVVGLPLEIVPIDRPGSKKKVRVALYADGQPVPQARVRAFPLAGHADDDAVVALTNAKGVATLRLGDRSLDWVYASVAMTYDASNDVPWRSTWTTLRTKGGR